MSRRIALTMAALGVITLAVFVLADAWTEGPREVTALALPLPIPLGCYPTNETVLGIGGALTGSSSAKRALGEAEIEVPPSKSAKVEDAKVTWLFRYAVTGNVGAEFASVPGTTSGFLLVTVDWLDSPRPDTTFISDCIAEAQIDEGHIEAELEGTLRNFPQGENTRRTGNWRAVATINVKPAEDDPLNVNFHFSFELGTTCFERYENEDTFNGFTEFEFGVNGEARGVMRVSPTVGEDVELGRAGVPVGFNAHQEHPCPDVFY